MGRDKATLTIGGRTLVERSVQVLRQRCDPVFVVAAVGQELPRLPIPVLRDGTPRCGPLPATGSGLRASAQAGAELAFVCAVDMPFLTAEFIDTLIALAVNSGAEIVLPWDGRDHYLAGVYRTGLAGLIDTVATAGERRMGALPGMVDTQRLVVADRRPLTNLNSPDDIHTLTLG